MKRLLAYLFIVLGLGLTFSVNANAQRDVIFCQNNESKSNLYIANSKKCWNDKYKIISEQEYIFTFLHGNSDLSRAQKVTLKNDLNTLYSDYSRNNLDKNRILNIIKNTNKLKPYLKIINNLNKTQIAKTEPTVKPKKKVKVAKKYKNIINPIFCNVSHSNNRRFNFDNADHLGQCIYKEISHTQAINSKFNRKYLNNKKTHFNICLRKNNQTFLPIEGSTQCPNNSVKLLYDGNDYYYLGKKTTQIAKIEEPKQEEFKPKKTNQDNEAPVITIAEAITVNDSSYEFKGKVTDKAKTIYVEVDGRSVDVKKGQFVVKGYSPIDKEISITAIDQWGNRSEPKIVKITIDVMNSSFAEVLEPLNASKIKSKSSNNKVALIIGIEQYEQSPKASYANLDAKYFFDYARKAFGVKNKNIKMLIDQEASLSKTNSAIFKWLPGKITANETDLIIFFSGHGLASSDGKAKYILPSNADPDLLSRTALSRSELFEEIIKLNPKSVTMFFDTCYSGVSRDEQTLLAAAKPLRGVVDDDNEVPDNFTIFTASKGDQISSGLKEAKHGIFSYYLMKGLEGKADANKDKDITNGELRAYMVKNVSDKALDLGRQQTPVLSGDPDKILMSYR